MEPIGEVIESSTTHFVAASYHLLNSPPFGSIVRVTTSVSHVYGLVYNIRTRSRAPGGRSIVRGKTYTGQNLYDDEIYRAHPDLKHVLQTEFDVLIIAYSANGRLIQQPPPQPPPIHYSVSACHDEIPRFGEHLDFLHTILQAPGTPADELLVAAVRFIALSRQDTRTFLVRVGRKLAQLLSHDYDRLMRLLHHVQTLYHPEQ